MINDRTQHLDLPLPHQDNQLTEDVLRLRQALTVLDAGFVQQEEVQTLTEGQTVVDLLQLTSTAGCSVFIEGIRLNASQWSRDAIPTRLTLSKSYPAGHTIAVVRQQGGV